MPYEGLSGREIRCCGRSGRQAFQRASDAGKERGVAAAVMSFVAAGAHDIWTTIAGRTLQGAGAISSVVVALAADLTREQHRTKTMAMIGAMIGLAFAVSLVAAPVLYQWIGMGGLFSLTGVLCLAALGVVKGLVPDVATLVNKLKNEAKVI